MEWVARRARAAILAALAVTALLLLLPVPPFGAVAASASTAESHGGCTTSCGNISIPYPFGVEPGCYHDGGFNLTCNHSYHPPKLFLGDGTVQVLHISIPDGTVRINRGSVNFQLGTEGAKGTWAAGGLGYAGPYFLAVAQNSLLAVGCDDQVVLLRENNSLVSSCSPFCLGVAADIDVCNGIGCCQATILEGRASYVIELHKLKVGSLEDTYASVFIVDSGYSFSMRDYYFNSLLMIPAMLTWTIKSSPCHRNGSSPSCRSNHSFCQRYTDVFGPRHHGHNCQCSDGYQGNPYISDGCSDINECYYPDIYPCYGDCKNTQGGYQCECPPGFKGNASIQNGCKDIDECAHPRSYSCYGICINIPGTFHCRCPHGTYGDPLRKGGCVTVNNSFAGLSIGLVVVGGSTLLLLALCAPFTTHKIKLRRVNKLKTRFFKQNHGLLLQQLISQKTDFGQRMIIPLWDLEQATHNFDTTREVGGGGHGVVYKGILDLKVVAVKKSKIVVQREIDDFINEVAILSQINHRNVVKLIGCCLETEVPLLVYEFISNGTLDHHLHVEGPVSLSWDDRIRVALEVARALSYLHSATSIPI